MTEEIAWELTLGEDGLEPHWLVDHLIRPGARARWLVDPITRAAKPSVDWTQVTSAVLLERLLITRAMQPRILSLRLRPVPTSVAALWALGSPQLRQELEEAAEHSVLLAVRHMLEDLRVERFLGVQVLHPISNLAEAPQLHVHVLLFESSPPINATAAGWLRIEPVTRPDQDEHGL